MYAKLKLPVDSSYNNNRISKIKYLGLGLNLSLNAGLNLNLNLTNCHTLSLNYLLLIIRFVFFLAILDLSFSDKFSNSKTYA